MLTLREKLLKEIYKNIPIQEIYNALVNEMLPDTCVDIYEDETYDPNDPDEVGDGFIYAVCAVGYEPRFTDGAATKTEAVCNAIKFLTVCDCITLLNLKKENLL